MLKEEDAFAQGYKAKGKKGKKEEVDIQEDGHVDVASSSFVNAKLLQKMQCKCYRNYKL